MTKANNKDNKIKETAHIPKLPAFGFIGKKKSMFAGNRNIGPRIPQQNKFNQSTFHTQHKGGTSGGK